MTEREEVLIEQLVQQAKAGEREAFSKIVSIMMNKIVALTYKMTADKDSAMDLAQESFVSAWQGLTEFKGDSKFQSWLYRIAVNKTLNYIRREKKKTNDNEMTYAVSSDNPEITYQQEEMRKQILEFMQGLPTQQRIVFELHFYKELKFEEISKITGKALGTVKTLYREAVIKLRHEAEKQGWQS